MVVNGERVRAPMTQARKVSPDPKEARSFQGHRAGMVTRLIASILDGIVVGAMMGCAYLGWVGLTFLLDPRAFTWPDVNGVLVPLIIFLCVATLYLAAAWAITGRSYGCQVMGRRVVNFREQRMKPIGAFLRAIFCVFFPIGLFWSAVNRRNRSLADVLPRTSVIYDWETHDN